jgi:UDP-N-acetylglucosamine 1-carboxyvinyltransferase
MQKFIIQGGRPLKGEITVAGDKNTALKLLPATVLVPGTTTFTNVPGIQDVKVMLELLTSIGAAVSQKKTGEVNVSTEAVKKTDLPSELVTKVRASSMFIGPLLARFGKVSVHHPGGDVIGERPLDLLLDGLSVLGADIKQDDRTYHISAAKMRGGRFIFRKVSVTVTENLLLAATLAKGKTELVNAAMEPGVIALADFLNAHGAKIHGAGTPTVIIEGVQKLRTSAAPVAIIPDRIEAGTFACLAAATNSPITISACNPTHLETLLKTLELMGATFTRDKDSITHVPHKKPLRAVEVVTHEYPGIATDFLAPLVVLSTQAQGLSLIRETIFEGRLFFTDKLKQMGAQIIMADPFRVVVNGPATLRGRKIISPDIRAGIALVIAGLLAEGTTTIGNIYQIDRGYEAIEERLAALGADMKRVETDYF